MTVDRLDSITRRKFTYGTIGAGLVGVAGCLGRTGDGNGEDDDFPSEDIDIIIPWSAGAGTDRVTRALIEQAERFTDVSFVATNVEGGTGSVGLNQALQEPSDGYTLTNITGSTTLLELTGIADITPMDFRCVYNPNADDATITVQSDAPYDTYEEFVDYAEDNPGEIRVGNSGIGGIWHVGAAGFAQKVGIELSHIGYDAGSDAVAAVQGGEIEAVCATPPEVAPAIEAGDTKMLVQMSNERHPEFPDIPTLQEKGVDWVAGTPRGIAAHKDTPEDRIQTLAEIFREARHTDEFENFLEEQGFTPLDMGPDEYQEYVEGMYEGFSEVIDDIDIEG